MFRRQKTIFCGAYVDDILFVGENDKIFSEINELKKEFELTIKEDISEYIGCNLVVKDEEIIIQQRKMI